jgi:hypothetical protein
MIDCLNRNDKARFQSPRLFSCIINALTDKELEDIATKAITLFPCL